MEIKLSNGTGLYVDVSIKDVFLIDLREGRSLSLNRLYNMTLNFQRLLPLEVHTLQFGEYPIHIEFSEGEMLLDIGQSVMLKYLPGHHIKIIEGKKKETISF